MGKVVTSEDLKTDLEKEETYKWVVLLKAKNRGFLDTI